MQKWYINVNIKMYKTKWNVWKKDQYSVIEFDWWETVGTDILFVKIANIKILGI